jgi:hypothetical protein
VRRIVRLVLLALIAYVALDLIVGAVFNGTGPGEKVVLAGLLVGLLLLALSFRRAPA